MSWKVYHVTGWCQYKSSNAKKVDCYQIAETEDQAMEDAAKTTCPDEHWRAALATEEMIGGKPEEKRK